MIGLAMLACTSCSSPGTPKPVEPAKVTAAKSTDWTTLIKNEDTKAIESAIASGADPNELVYFPGAKGKISDFEAENVPPIWLAVFYHKPKILTLLLAKGAKPNTCASRVGDPAILLAAKIKQKDSIDILLQHGAEIDHANEGGFNALIGATIYRKLDIVNFLLEKKANPNVITKDGFTPLALLISFPFDNHSNDVPILKAFVKHGADIHFKIRKTTLFEMAVAAGNEEIALALLQEDQSFMNKAEKQSLIDLAKQMGMSKLVEYMKKV